MLTTLYLKAHCFSFVSVTEYSYKDMGNLLPCLGGSEECLDKDVVVVWWWW